MSLDCFWKQPVTLKMFTGLLQLKVLILLIFYFHSVNVSEHGMVNRTNLKDCF